MINMYHQPIHIQVIQGNKSQTEMQPMMMKVPPNETIVPKPGLSQSPTSKQPEDLQQINNVLQAPIQQLSPEQPAQASPTSNVKDNESSLEGSEGEADAEASLDS